METEQKVEGHENQVRIFHKKTKQKKNKKATTKWAGWTETKTPPEGTPEGTRRKAQPLTKRFEKK